VVNDMNGILTVCQPGWLAVFQQLNGVGFFTEPIACWFLVQAPHQDVEVHPICALGGDVCDATLANNYIGVVGPGGDPKQLAEAARENAAKKTT
jgi:hypothetical protein